MNLSLKVSKALAVRLAAAARRQGTTKSALIRQALEQFLNGDRSMGQGLSCYDLAKDLAGCLKSGVRDLSSNPRHMEGFGQ